MSAESSAAHGSGPLAGVRVIEIDSIGALPFAGMMLADLGAEILRIEAPRPRDLKAPTDPDADPVRRGRWSMTADLRNPSDRSRLLEILKSADVLIEGLRPGKMEALGLGPDECLVVAPHLVYGRSTGWGQTGPLAATAGHDPNYLGYTGALYWLGGGTQPALPPFGLTGDVTGGSLYLVIGVLAALQHVARTGQGQVVDASILDGTLSMMTTIFGMQRAGVLASPHWKGMLSGECPYAAIYETADGGHVTVCALERKFYDILVAKLELAAKDLPDRDDTEAWPALRQRFAECFLSKPRDHWEELFTGSDACVSPVLSLEEAINHPINAARRAFLDGTPVAAPRFSVTPIDHAPRHDDPAEALLGRWAAR